MRHGTQGHLTICFFIFHVGLIHTSYLFQVTWREEERRIDDARRSHASIAWTQTTDPSISTWLKGVIITVGFSETWQHHMPRSRGRRDHRRSSKTRALNKELWRPGWNLEESIWRVGSRSNGADLRRFITPDLKTSSRPSDHDLTAKNRCNSKRIRSKPISRVRSRSDGWDLIITVRDEPFHHDRWSSLNASIERLSSFRLINRRVLRRFYVFLRDFT